MNPSSPPDFDFPPPPADLPPPSPSPRSGRKSTDKENLPERLERNSKLAKFREVQSSDSCESLGLNSNQQVKSPMSPVSENRTLGSPAVGSLSSPGSTLDHDYKIKQPPTTSSRSATNNVKLADNSDAIKPFISDTGKFNQEPHYFKKFEFSRQKKVCIFRLLNRKCAKKVLAV